VASHQELEAILFKEARCNVGPKLNANSTLARVASILVAGVRPEALAHDALICGLANSIELRNVFKLDSVLGKESSVYH